VRQLWTVARPARVPEKHSSSFTLLLCWLLWKHHNDVVFSNAQPSLPRFWRSCRDEARDWCLRLPRGDQMVTEEAWCLTFPSM
jgi:hypothetical protein